MNKTIILLFIPIFLSCTKEMKSKELNWTSQSGTPAPAVPRSEEFKSPEVHLTSDHETLERSPQMWGPAIVENKFVTKIYDKSGNLVFLKAQYADANWTKIEKEIARLDHQKYQFLENFKKSNEKLRTAAHIYDPIVIITEKYGVRKPFYQIDYVDAAQTGVFRLKVTASSFILSSEKVSSAFEQGHGFVYPEGPKLSGIAEVPLPQLVGDGTLTKSTYKVISQSSEKVQSTDEFFKYEPTDPRFDQVQTFYFVDQALHFFQDKLGVTIPFFLEVQTDVGSPDKTNAMFYYHGQVRLGSGDGVTYTNVAKDPSIVTHETSHALVEALSHLPMGQGEGGSLNEAFADFFTTSFLDNPNLGEVAFMEGPYSRTVNNGMKVAEKNGGLYHDSLIVSGTFYLIKKEIGTKPSLDLAVKTLMRLGPAGNFSNFKQSVQQAMEQNFTDEQRKMVLNVLAEKGW